MNLILTVFDAIRGPITYINIPEQISNDEILKKINGFLNLDLGKGFFVINLVEENLKTFNFYFEIHSEWARGGHEMCMLSILTDKNYKDALFFDLLKEIYENISTIENIFKGFYKNYESREDFEIEVKYKELKTILVEIYERINETIKSTILGNILLLGLNKVGKSSIIARLKTKVFSTKIKPTLALTLIEQIIESYHFKIIDVSGQKKLRDQWWSYTKYPEAVIYVASINDIINKGEKLRETQIEFENVIERFSEEEFKKTPILICVNKIDLIDDLDVKSVENEINILLNLDDFDGNYKIQLTSAVNGTGIAEGFKWIVSKLMEIS